MPFSSQTLLRRIIARFPGIRSASYEQQLKLGREALSAALKDSSLVMDIKTRDYVAAAQTRGESPWYIMLWEILPNARGPLIVDACLRIGYTTILLGTLGYFGLGLAPESPDWGTAIKDASRLLRSFIHPALPPTIALMSFVLGLNLLADSLREQSMKD